MKKSSSSLLVSLLAPVVVAVTALGGCSSAEMPSTGAGSGGRSGGTGNTSGSTGGSSARGTGGFASVGSGGSTSVGSGGSPSSQGTGGTIVSAGTGGAPSSSGSGGSVVVGGSGGAGTSTPGSLMATAGFATNGAWKGYAYTAMFPPAASTVTITPACPAPCFAGATLCAMGTVGADMTYGSGALVGWNINQEMATTAVSPPITPAATTGSGLFINVSGNVAGLRAQIQNGTMNWCANLMASGGVMIPWGMFNTACWNPSMGMPFVPGSPITAVQVVVPSGLTAVPFSFCLVDAKSY